jgi:glycosyltransferase involved in cell wall biosynthesis
MVSHYFESHRGGIEIVAGQLTRALARLEHQVVWIGSDATPEPAATENCRVVAIGVTNAAEKMLGIPYPLPTPRGIARIWREVRQADAVLLHDTLYLSCVVAFAAARWSGKPLVVVGHVGTVPYRNLLPRLAMALANRLVARTVLARADRVAFVSEVTARYFATVGFRAPPVLIFNGVDSDLFRPPPDSAARAESRRRFGLPADRPVVLFVGRFVEKKGLAVLHRMARRRPDIFWALAGWGDIDPRRWDLPNLAVFSELSGPSLVPLYQASDAFVLPSVGEGFPLVIQEAMACGLPVVCGAETARADTKAAPFLTGVAIDENDPDRTAAAFSRAVDRVLQDESGEAAAIDRARFAAARYSWASAATRYIELLQPLLVEAKDLPLPGAAAGVGRQ